MNTRQLRIWDRPIILRIHDAAIEHRIVAKVLLRRTTEHHVRFARFQALNTQLHTADVFFDQKAPLTTIRQRLWQRGSQLCGGVHSEHATTGPVLRRLHDNRVTERRPGVDGFDQRFATTVPRLYRTAVPAKLAHPSLVRKAFRHDRPDARQSQLLSDVSRSGNRNVYLVCHDSVYAVFPADRDVLLQVINIHGETDVATLVRESGRTRGGRPPSPP